MIVFFETAFFKTARGPVSALYRLHHLLVSALLRAGASRFGIWPAGKIHLRQGSGRSARRAENTALMQQGAGRRPGAGIMLILDFSNEMETAFLQPGAGDYPPQLQPMQEPKQHSQQRRILTASVPARLWLWR
ncbi:MAG: hypothetical protein ACQES0_02815 [Bacteroidota bacterium]